MTTINASQFVTQFKKNCPRVALTKAEERELARLFVLVWSLGQGSGIMSDSEQHARNVLNGDV